MNPKRLQVEVESGIMERSRRIGIHRYSAGRSQLAEDQLASETLIHLHSDKNKIASLLGTPTDLKELFLGHACSEGYGCFPDAKIEAEQAMSGSVTVTIDQSMSPPDSIRGVITSSCGACNADGLEELMEGLPIYSHSHFAIQHHILYQALESMKTLQIGFTETGGMHAAALWNHQLGLRHLREDIGRHNAVDKTIGSGLIEGVTFDEELLFLSGRCGWDIVAKAARSGIGTIVCIGACSTLAADTARSLGMRIYSFMKRESSVAIGLVSH
jgi:FdhD protein